MGELLLKKAWNWLGVHMGFLCPDCKTKLKQIGSVWYCSKCKREYENKN